MTAQTDKILEEKDEKFITAHLEIARRLLKYFYETETDHEITFSLNYNAVNFNVCVRRSFALSELTHIKNKLLAEIEGIKINDLVVKNNPGMSLREYRIEFDITNTAN